MKPQDEDGDNKQKEKIYNGSKKQSKVSSLVIGKLNRRECLRKVLCCWELLN